MTEELLFCGLIVSLCGLVIACGLLSDLKREIVRRDNRIDSLLVILDRAQRDAESADDLSAEIAKEFKRRSGDDIFQDDPELDA
jgi:hypothetical protein